MASTEETLGHASQAAPGSNPGKPSVLLSAHQYLETPNTPFAFDL